LPLLTWHLGDEVILAVMVIVVILLFRMFKRSGWL
jgi:Mg2+ and Co2+ transporter CorA